MIKKNMTTTLILICIFSISCLVMFGCNEPSTQRKGEKEQETVMERARANVPTPQIDNFLTRKNVSKWMDRMDMPSKLFYIYVYSDTGSAIGYFVAQYRPVSTATFLTPPKREIHVRGSGANPLGPAPALDGTYYGEGGASQQYFWFDAETDAFIEIKGLNYIISDQPLSIDVPQLHVNNVNEK